MAVDSMKRFSLRSIFLLVGFCALLLGYLLLLTRNHSLSREVQSLRAEVGYLALVDESRVNVVEVPTNGPYEWRWRVYAPPGTVFDAGIMTGKIPSSGTGRPNSIGVDIPSETNGVLITASVTNDHDGGKLLELKLGNGNSLRVPISMPSEEFVDGSANVLTAGQNGVQVCDLNDPIILHRRSLIEPTSPTTSSEPRGLSRGILFWITPREKP